MDTYIITSSTESQVVSGQVDSKVGDDERHDDERDQAEQEEQVDLRRETAC